MRLAIAPGPTVHWLFRSHDLLSKYRSLQCSSVAHVYQAFLSLPPKFLTPAQIKPKSVRIETDLFFLLWADAHLVYARAWTLCCFHSLVTTQIFRRALTGSVDSCAEIKSAPSVAYVIFCKSLEEGAGKRWSECGSEVTHDAVACTPATQRRTPFIKVVSVYIFIVQEPV